MTSGMSKRLSAFGVVIALASCATELPQPSMPPAAPAGLMALPGDRSINLRWDDPRDAEIASYEVRLRAQRRSQLAALETARRQLARHDQPYAAKL